MNIAGHFEAQTLEALRGIPGLDVVVEPGGGADAVITHGGTKTHVQLALKTQVNTATAWQLVRHAEGAKLPLIVVAATTTQEARRILGKHGIGVVDAGGNAHINLAGLLVHVENPRPTTKTKAPTRLRGKAGVVAQALLLEPTRNWQVGELAERADVSVGLTHRVLARLDHEGVMTAEGVGPARVRRVGDPPALLDLFAEETDEKPARVLAYFLAQSPKTLITDLAAGLAKTDFGWALTGAAAASLLAPFVTAVPVVDVWVQAAAGRRELFDAAGADPVGDGANLVFWQAKADVALAFHQETNGIRIANIFRIYADLLADPRRGREQAQNFRQEVIGF